MTDGSLPYDIDHPDPCPHLPRVVTLAVLTILLFAGLMARLYILQVVRYSGYERLASHNRLRHEPGLAPRGGVFDQRGKLLAGSRIAHRVAILNLADPARQLASRRAIHAGSVAVDFASAVTMAHLPQPTLDEQLAELAALLKLDGPELTAIREQLADRSRPKFTPVVVRDDVEGEELCRVEERLWRLPSVVIERVPFRSYPYGPAFAHIIGYVGVISPSELDARRARQDEQIAAMRRDIAAARRELEDADLARLTALQSDLDILIRLRSQADSIVGKTGLEDRYEDRLQGDPGIRTWLVNARNEPIKLLSTTEGRAGQSLILNLDAGMQQVAARMLAGRRGSAVAIDPRSGAVLTLYGSPSYDSNLFIPKISPDDWDRILNDRAHPLQNRAIRNAYPPGSTFKMITSAAGLASGAITDHFGVSCPGGMQVGSRFKRCWATHGGGIDLNRALAVSCDVFYYRATLKMGPDALRQMAAQFGIGEPTGIDLPNEQSGRLPTEAWHEAHHKRGWYPGDTTNIAIGQGDIATTSLQMARACATVANGGKLFRPQVVREVRDRDGKVLRPWKPELQRQIKLSPENFEKIRRGMRAAVTNGTSGLAALPNIAVAGKTGSAEDPPRVLPHAWFVCFAPYDDPEIAIAVMVENAGHGGTNSAPVAKELMIEYFKSRGREP